jgi:hypothetical protein
LETSAGAAERAERDVERELELDVELRKPLVAAALDDMGSGWGKDFR